MPHDTRARPGDLLGRRQATAILPAAERRLLYRMNTLAGLMKRLDRQLDARLNGCACGDGECPICRLDRAAPVIRGVMAAARECAGLQQRLETAQALRRLDTGMARLTGTKGLHRTHGEHELQARLDAAREQHDALLSLLCNPETGLQPDHPLCADYCPAAARG